MHETTHGATMVTGTRFENATMPARGTTDEGDLEVLVRGDIRPDERPAAGADARRADGCGAVVGNGSRQVEAAVAGLGARPDVGGRPGRAARR